MWLHAPRGRDEVPSPPALTLAHEFELWLLASGKPTLTRSSEVDWTKAAWLHALDLWEPRAAQDSRVQAHLAANAGRFDPNALRVLGLCAGYGGLEMGVHMARDGAARTVGYIERQAYAAAVLASRMKEGALDEAPIWDDLETFDCAPWRGRVDLVAGGIPCQGASIAGSRKGVDDERWLWPAFWRIVREVEAPFLFLENVPGLLSVNRGGAFENILGDLGTRGWSASWDCVPAASVGAPHLRDRVFLFAADPNRVRVRFESERDQRQGWSERAPVGGQAEPDDDRAPGSASDADGKRRRRKGRRHVHARQPDVERRCEVASDADYATGKPRAGEESHARGARRDTEAARATSANADHEPASAQLGLEPGQRSDVSPAGGSTPSDADVDGVQAGKRRRRAQRNEGRAAVVGGGIATDPDAARLGRDEGSEVDAIPVREGGADARGSREHGASADAVGVELAPGRGQEQLALGTDAQRGGGRGRAASPADASGSRSQRAGTKGAIADGDRSAGRARSPSESDSHGRESEWRSRELDEGERTELRRDVDRCSGARVGHADADAIADRLGRILDAGGITWDWGGAPSPLLRGLHDGGPDRLVGDTHADELHLLGNGVVPLCAAFAFVVLWNRLIGPDADLDVP